MTKVMDQIRTKMSNEKLKVMNKNRLASFESKHDQADLLQKTLNLLFKKYMGAYGCTGMTRYVVTTLRLVSKDYSLVHSTFTSINDSSRTTELLVHNG